MRFHIHPDQRGVGDIIRKRALDRGHMLDPMHPQAAFFRLTNYGDTGMNDFKRAIQRGIPTVPEYVASVYYDDKLAQASALKSWIPETRVYFAPPDAVPFAYPFISKTSHGSGSKNVRLIENERQARAEIDLTFGRGIPCNRGPQTGYLYWQEFIAGNDGDVRVCITGDHMFGLRRMNHPGRVMASGSGRCQPIDALTPRDRDAFVMADEIARKIGSRWCCFDFVFSPGRVYCLEVSFAWTEDAYNGCLTFDRETLKRDGRSAKDWPEFAVDELERIAAA